MNYLNNGGLKNHKFSFSPADDWTPIFQYRRADCKILIERAYSQSWKLQVLLKPTSVYGVRYAHSFCNSLLYLLYDLPFNNIGTEVHIASLLVMDNLSSLDPIL